jgi:hypothetical protein
MRGITCAARFRQGSGDTQFQFCVALKDAKGRAEVVAMRADKSASL